MASIWPHYFQFLFEVKEMVISNNYLVYEGFFPTFYWVNGLKN